MQCDRSSVERYVGGAIPRVSLISKAPHVKSGPHIVRIQASTAGERTGSRQHSCELVVNALLEKQLNLCMTIPWKHSGHWKHGRHWSMI